MGFDSGPNVKLGTLPCPDCEEDGSGKPLNALLASTSGELPALATAAGDSKGSIALGGKAMRSPVQSSAVTPKSAAASAAGSASVVASVSALMAVFALIVAAVLPMFPHGRRCLGRTEPLLAARTHAPIEDEHSYSDFPGAW